MAGFFQEDEILGKAYDGRLMRRLLSYLRPYKGLVAIAFVLLVFLSFADIAPPIITKFLIDSAIAPAVNGDIPAAEGLRLLVPLGAAYLGVLLASAALRYGQNILTTYVGQRAMYDLRVQLFGHLQSLSLSFFDRNPVGRLMTRITNDIDALTDMVTQGVVSIFGDFLMLIGIAVVLLFLDWRLALLTYATLPIIVALTFYFRKTMRESFRSIRIRLARINAYLNENISGMSIVQLFTREPRAYRQFDELNTDLLNANQGAIKAMSLFFPAVTFTRAGAASAIFIAGGYWALGGQLTIGTLLAFWQLLDQFFRPIQDLSEKYNILQSAMASSERVFRLLDTEATIVDAPHPVALPSVRGEITMDNVSFAYNEGDWVLRDVDFKISAGESVAIVGATGAGKTSIISLISRFYDVQKGRILLDGVDLRDLAQRDVRRHVGVVLQDPFIFAGTIASNIRLNESGITDEQVRSAARFVNADKFIERLPDAYETVVTERGSTLSVGQKQLLAFARAIAFNPEIMLVLDEATSSVDTETEHLIQDALKKLMVGRTSIIIAHRLSTIQNVDRIIVLHKGRVAEMGSHKELLGQQGVYHRLYELQYRAHEGAST
ncbi:MAG TPA: ABC transporter ATP-binding protein [Candidatus Saccharimonadales bacterium]|jgi:ATP-binding cassette subfamily B protein|nr:ABC transporter ATP-binding protein [Candidatus Saccharimonadales bacterium]